jgi:hypothetical protein
MKRFLVPAALGLTLVLFAGCVDEPPPKKPVKKSGFHPPPTPPPDAAQNGENPEAAPDASTKPEKPAPDVKPPPPVPTQPVTTGELPYAKPGPGKPGFVFSPYDQYKGYIDVRGFPPGTEVKDPYSGKSFLVP